VTAAHGATSGTCHKSDMAAQASRARNEDCWVTIAAASTAPG
jgi:hypothetical protein